ncbi:MAG: transcription antitermination factor NusB [Gammaproteobacteria bacterium]|nr:transcription antitermination factor NusB [Gammaproteobacteria bacterium]MCP4088910.1 transcription antitermination factor NusB [Gammaproteobacteria bacterium]
MAAKGRHGSRRMLLQAFYQMQVAGHSMDELAEQFTNHPEAVTSDMQYFNQQLSAVFGLQGQLEMDIADFGDIPPDQLDPTEHAVLWVALAELRVCGDIPTKVIINEAIELAKEFGAEGGYRYINGLLDKASAELR